MNKSEFIAAVAEEMGKTKAEAARYVDAIFKVMKQALKEGKDIRLIGFGSLRPYKIGPKQVRNPQNGQKINVPASTRVRLTIGKELKNLLNGKR